MGQGCRRRGAEADCDPLSCGGCAGVSLRLPEVSSGGDCTSCTCCFLDRLELSVLVPRGDAQGPGPPAVSLSLPRESWLGKSKLRVAALRTPIPKSAPDPQLHGHPSHPLVPMGSSQGHLPRACPAQPSGGGSPAAACSEEEEEEAGFTSLNCQQRGETGPAAGVTPVQRLPHAGLVQDTELEHMDVISCWIQKPLQPFRLPKGSFSSVLSRAGGRGAGALG